ncbi:4-aminobutyrate--2-oxoglutarate transaminase [Roseovarius sp. HI0049]|nr:4-aminobutyrate--2-oxoglutarate transaminase [Roseovarius sp. HI0049]
MATNSALEKRRHAAVSNSVATLHPFVVDHAKNAEIWDVEGNRYVDFAGGIGVLNVGHNHPTVVSAIETQTRRLIHTSFQVAHYEPYVELAERLNYLTPGSFAKKSLFLNSGAEAVENAVKIARHATGRPGVIAFAGGFHGRTLLTMGMTGKVKPYKSGFGPFPESLLFSDFPDHDDPDTIEKALASLHRIFESQLEPERIAAMIIEPIQGENGFRVAPFDFLTALREICDQYRIVLISDEIQSGIARSGHWFSIEHSGVVPDIITVAKSLGGGLPISAVVGRADLMDTVPPGGLGGTFAGNPVACAAGITVLQVIENENLLKRSHEIGEQIRSRLRDPNRLGGSPHIGQVRGLGGMVGIEIVTDQTSLRPDKALMKALVEQARDDGLLLITSGQHENVIRVLVPITASPELVSEGLDTLENSLAKVSNPSSRGVV